MRFSTGIILSALAFNVFAATPTNISPGPLLDRRDAEPTMTDPLWKRNGEDDTKPTMTDPLWKRNNEDDAEGSVPSPLRSDAEASGGSSRSGRGSSRSRDPSGSGSPSRFRQLSNPITMNGLVVRVYDKYQVPGQRSVARKFLRLVRNPALLLVKERVGSLKGELARRNDWPFSALANLLDEMGSKMPVGEKDRMMAGFVEKLESIITKSRDYAKSHRRLLQATAEAIASGKTDMALALEKASNNAYMWVDHIDTLVKEEFTRFLTEFLKIRIAYPRS
ncbi:hypothetical protein BASA50_004501 [Batrachochytrium salamandrivorans]|uniref:RxLR effector candidate protein n=1 Tax=Batrachochytrium salamandrivorans TaxID=1357716 RepID=A0ABQ8FFW1_9FUNG|nr:hypothetical protein BASA50_004501 [Batrachochytrium salamandrivorans]